MRNYIWTDYSPDNIYRVATKGISPYLEVFGGGDKIVPVNIMYRLDEVFLPGDALATSEEIDRQMQAYQDDEQHKEIANLILHYIAQLDRTRGLRLEESLDTLHDEELKRGAYGRWAADVYKRLSPRHKRNVARCLTLNYLNAQRETMYSTALQALFRGVKLYLEQSTNIVHVYLDEDRTQEAEERYRLCEYLFRDILLETHVMWRGEHMGIIGWDETMCLNETALG